MEILPLWSISFILATCISYSLEQQYQQPGGQGVRVAPGVPPQQYDPNAVPQYQAPPPPGGYQQAPPPPPPQHHQQQQQQQFHQQAPPHQHQAPGQANVPQQFQTPPGGDKPPQPHGGGGGHDHGHAHGSNSGQPILDASKIAQERQHIQEHMDLPIDTSQMSEQELQFHYFKMHDADNNNKLDGSELVKSLIHWHDQSNHDPRGGVPVPEPKIFKDEELSQMIDPILANDDRNRDGYIDYGEFVQAQSAAAAKSASQHAA